MKKYLIYIISVACVLIVGLIAYIVYENTTLSKDKVVDLVYKQMAVTLSSGDANNLLSAALVNDACIDVEKISKNSNGYITVCTVGNHNFANAYEKIISQEYSSNLEQFTTDFLNVLGQEENVYSSIEIKISRNSEGIYQVELTENNIDGLTGGVVSFCSTYYGKKDISATEINELFKNMVEKINYEDNVKLLDYKSHLGTWYLDVGPSEYERYTYYELITIKDKGNNKAEIEFEDGTVEQIIFISDNVAHGETSILENATVQVPEGKMQEQDNVSVVKVYDFTPIDGKESIRKCYHTSDTDYWIVTEYQYATRNVDTQDAGVDKVKHTSSPTKAPTKSRLSVEEAKSKLENSVGDVLDEDSGFISDGKIYTVNGKEYYQFEVRGIVGSHVTTVDAYAISVDGTEIINGDCTDGKLIKFDN